MTKKETTMLVTVVGASILGSFLYYKYFSQPPCEGCNLPASAQKMYSGNAPRWTWNRAVLIPTGSPEAGPVLVNG